MFQLLPSKLRYPLSECLEHLGISRATFNRRVEAGQYQIIRDGKRLFMSHEQLVEAAKGDGE